MVGVLLIFALMVTPAAIAHRLTKLPRMAMALSVMIALSATWLGIFIAYYEPYPVSFFITSIVFVLYILTLVFQRIGMRVKAYPWRDETKEGEDAKPNE